MEEASRRSRVIERKLKSVEELPAEDSFLLLGDSAEIVEVDDEPDARYVS